MPRRVRDLMRRDFIQVSPDEPAADVLSLMGMARVRALPVVAEGRTSGLVAHRDLARAALGLGEERTQHPLGPVAPFVRPIAPVSPETPLSEAVRRMLGEGTPCLVAVEGSGGDERVVGLLTENDLLRAAYLNRPSGS